MENFYSAPKMLERTKFKCKMETCKPQINSLSASLALSSQWNLIPTHFLISFLFFGSKYWPYMNFNGIPKMKRKFQMKMAFRLKNQRVQNRVPIELLFLCLCSNCYWKFGRASFYLSQLTRKQVAEWLVSRGDLKHSMHRKIQQPWVMTIRSKSYSTHRNRTQRSDRKNHERFLIFNQKSILCWRCCHMYCCIWCQLLCFMLFRCSSMHMYLEWRNGEHIANFKMNTILSVKVPMGGVRWRAACTIHKNSTQH